MVVTQLLIGLVVLGAEPDTRPNVGVFPLTSMNGAPADLGRVLSDLLVTFLRDSSAFRTVVSGQEIDDVMNLERQKQLMNCDAESCVAEVAGALGVELLVTGSVSRLGTAMILHLRMLDTRTGRAVATFSETSPSVAQELLVASVERGARHLAQKLQPHSAVPAPVPQPAPPSAPIPVAREVPPPGPLRMPLFAAAAGLGALGAVAFLGGVLAVVGASGVKAFLNTAPPAARVGTQMTQLQALYVGLFLVGGALLLLVPVGTLGAVGLAAGGMVQ